MYHQLTQEERHRITAHRMAGCSQAEIARLPQRAPSTISRELRRNATRHDGDYRAEKAHSYATARRRRCRRGAQFSAQEMARVTQLLRRRWSPEQVAGTLTNSSELAISYETICGASAIAGRTLAGCCQVNVTSASGPSRWHCARRSVTGAHSD